MPSIRMNISVLDTLKAKMDAVADRVNWSQVASAAFERKIEIMEQFNDGLEDGLARLRASKEESYDELRQEGKSWGIEAAKNHFSYSALKKVAKWREETIVSSTDEEKVAYAFWKENNLAPPTSLFFKDYGIDEDLSLSSHFTEGFIEGAVEVFDQV
ncbi:MAG: hypothetical protein U0840_11085 [Gemmataceae bacterium]